MMLSCVLASPALLVSPARPATVSTGRLTPPVARAKAGARKEARSRKRSASVNSWYDSGTRLVVDNLTPAAKPMTSVASQGGLAGWWDSIVSRSPSFGGKNRLCTNIEVPGEVQDPVISWYDAGARLAVEAPTAAPAPPPAPAPTPAPVPVAPVVSWFDTGIRLQVAEEPAPAPEAEEEDDEDDIWISGGF